jgi:prepilin-type processing-associated H-X9-DG protein
MRLPNVLWFFVVLIAIVLLAILMPEMGKVRGVAKRIVCGTNLKSLTTAMTVYTNNYDGILPTENWCDLLIEKADVTPDSFICRNSDAIEGESCYAMNESIVGKSLNDLPANVVLFFETDKGIESGSRSTSIKNRRFFEYYRMYDEDILVYKGRFNQLGGLDDVALRHDERRLSGCNIAFTDGHVEFVTEDRIADLQWTAD